MVGKKANEKGQRMTKKMSEKAMRGKQLATRIFLAGMIAGAVLTCVLVRLVSMLG